MDSYTWRHKIFLIPWWNKSRDVSDLFLLRETIKSTDWIIPARLKRRILQIEDVNKFKDETPPLKKGSSKMFRNLRDKGKPLQCYYISRSEFNFILLYFYAGIISYTEYLFLLSILTSMCLDLIESLNRSKYIFRFSFAEPKSGFKIAFNMFDTDGNQRVDKDEFLVVSIKSSSWIFQVRQFGVITIMVIPRSNGIHIYFRR